MRRQVIMSLSVACAISGFLAGCGSLTSNPGAYARAKQLVAVTAKPDRKQPVYYDRRVYLEGQDRDAQVAEAFRSAAPDTDGRIAPAPAPITPGEEQRIEQARNR
jgi:hypothetical protein